MARLDEVFAAYEIFLFDLEDARTFYLSPNLERMLGVTEEDLGMHKIRPLADLCHADDWPALRRHLALMRGAVERQTRCIDYRLRDVREGGYHHWISFQQNTGHLFDRRDTLLGISTDFSGYLQREWRHNCHFRDRMRMILESVQMSIRARNDVGRMRANA